VPATVEARPTLSAAFFAATAAVLFYPFFFGQFVVGGTDLVLTHYPNLLFGYREFGHFGRFSLWNRYIFAGADVTASVHAHFLNPLYWPVLLFPERYIFHALTAIFILFNGLTGWIWSRIAVHLGVRGSGGLVVGLVAQAGTFFWLAIIAFTAVPMYFSASSAIYLIYRRGSKGLFASYVMLSAVFGLLFVTPQPAYILGFFLPVCAVFLVENDSGWWRHPWRGFAPVFIAAVFTGVLLATYRIVPVLSAIVGGSYPGDQHWPGPHVNDAVLGLYNAPYIGIAPLALIYAALRSGAGIKTGLLALTLVALEFLPIAHEAVFRLASNFAFLFLLIRSIRHLASVEQRAFEPIVRELIAIAGIIIATSLGLHARMLSTHPGFAGMVGLRSLENGFGAGILACLVIVVLLWRLPARTFASRRFALIGTLVGAVIAASAGVASLSAGRMFSDGVSPEVFRNSLIAIVGCLVVVWTAEMEADGAPRTRMPIYAFAAVTVAMLLVGLQAPHRLAVDAISSVVGAVARWGVVIALVAGITSIFARVATGRIDMPRAIPWIVALTAVDLVTGYMTYRYADVYEGPFARRIQDIYPPLTLAEMIAGGKAANLLSNPQLRLDQLDRWELGGRNANVCSEDSTAGRLTQQGSISICPEAGDEGNLFQDVALGPSVREVSLGAWVRGEPGTETGVFLTSPPTNAGSALVRAPGDGRWHWMTATVGGVVLSAVRAHVNVVGTGSMVVFSPRLVEGNLVSPAEVPNDGRDVAGTGGKFPASVDLDSYRVNHLETILDDRYLPDPHATDVGSVAEAPSYAGADSGLSGDFIDYLRAFRAPDRAWVSRGGLASNVEDDRLLDLLGVGYDVNKDGSVVFRPNAVPRLSAFSSFEVQADRSRALQRIKAADFLPTRTVLLDSAPIGVDSMTAPSAVSRLPYDTPAADRIRVQIAKETPRIVLFNDRYSADWRAHWNGMPLPIVRANVMFMAVALPQGPGELTLDFRPMRFYEFRSVSMGSAAFLLLAGAVALFRKLKPPGKVAEKCTIRPPEGGMNAA